MSVSSGSRLGPYEILSPLGAGGMGEVWRARDPKLGREVAIKVLPEELSSDRERLRRFENEARAASALNHPNIVTIHEIGEAGGHAFLVMERIEGRTLRELIVEGPLPVRRLLSIAAQIADGLARAHETGIVHRDLKPENVMVTPDGVVKILDFGLAKLAPGNTPSAAATEAPTATTGTEAGVVLGTVGYMSPEQASGKPLDYRSDQFTFGSILYEMATGRRAFRRDSPVETLSAIIRDDPEPAGTVEPRTPPPLRWIIERCLAKSPEERWVSTRDLARDLASLRDHLSETSVPAATPPSAALRSRVLHRPLLAVIPLLAAVAVGSFFLGREQETRKPLPSFHRLTFRRGHVWSARFAPDGQTVVYGAAWQGNRVDVFSTRPGNPESLPLPFPPADVLSISPGGELALCLGRHFIGGWETVGTLARAPLSGSAAREVLERVAAADWSRHEELAVVRQVGGGFRLEYPAGKTLAESTGWISHPRVSPTGDEVAFIDHPIPNDDQGSVWLVDRSGKKEPLSGRWFSIQGLAWASAGKEIWFTASHAGTIRALHAVTPKGDRRLIAESIGTLQDVSRDGRVLITRDDVRARVFAGSAGEPKERDLSWLDTPTGVKLSADGKVVLFSEAGEGGGPKATIYLRNTDGSPAVRLGDGYAMALSPDGKWALSTPTDFSELRLLPAGVGETLHVERGSVNRYEWADFLPDGERVVFAGNEKGRPSRLFVQDLKAAAAKAISPEGAGGSFVGHAVSPDGRFVTGAGTGSGFSLYPIGGGAAAPIVGLGEGEVPVQWSADGRFLYVCRRSEAPARVFRVEISTGRRELWKELLPDDVAGVYSTDSLAITRDGRSYAYTVGQILSNLYLVEGLR